MHDVNVLKWSHSIVNEENFINEWAAIENARSLAFDLGTYNGIFPLDMRLSNVSAKAYHHTGDWVLLLMLTF